MEIIAEILRIFVKGKLSDRPSGASKMGQNPIERDKRPPWAANTYHNNPR